MVGERPPAQLQLLNSHHTNTDLKRMYLLALFEVGVRLPGCDLGKRPAFNGCELNGGHWGGTHADLKSGCRAHQASFRLSNPH